MAQDRRLYLKHIVATSPVAASVGAIRNRVAGARAVPELALLRREDEIMGLVVARLVGKGDRCLDIGAHIGSFTHALRALAGADRVTSIEASPDKAAWLQRKYGADRVHAVAIADREGTLTFYEDLDRPGFNSLTRPAKATRVNAVAVPVSRLDTLFPDESFDFVKIDVEGHEYEALRSGETLLRRCRPTILFEAGPIFAPRADKVAALFDWLTGPLGYRINAPFEMFHDRPPLTKETFGLYRTYPFLAFNYVAVPVERANDRV